MELTRQRIFHKHLKPARPLRRLLPVDVGGSTEPTANYASCAQALIDIVDGKDMFYPGPDVYALPAFKTNNTVEQFLKTVNPQDQKKERLCYSRDFLIGLASCPAAMKRPAFLPDQPIVLRNARDQKFLFWGTIETSWNDGKDIVYPDQGHGALEVRETDNYTRHH